MPRYSCALNGRCERDEHGAFSSYYACRRQCIGAGSKDVIDIIYSYEPATAAYLAPSDRRRVALRLTGVSFSARDAQAVLLALAANDMRTLALYPELFEYLVATYPLEELVDRLYGAATAPAMDLLIALGEVVDTKLLYINALMTGNCDFAHQLEEGVELENDEIKDLLSAPHPCTLIHLFDIYGNDYFNAEMLARQAVAANDRALFERIRETGLVAPEILLSIENEM